MPDDMVRDKEALWLTIGSRSTRTSGDNLMHLTLLVIASTTSQTRRQQATVLGLVITVQLLWSRYARVVRAGGGRCEGDV